MRAPSTLIIHDCPNSEGSKVSFRIEIKTVTQKQWGISAHQSNELHRPGVKACDRVQEGALRGSTLHDSKYMAFWKSPKSRDSEMCIVARAWGKERRTGV
jgi:hypothetical protein